MESKNISAFIIAGGKSKRFGQDKSQYIFNDKPLIMHVFDVLTPIFDDIFIISSKKNKQKILSVTEYIDVIPNIGPIGGLYTALCHNKGDRAFICACDMPFLNSDLIKYMIPLSTGFDIIIPAINGMYEPLHAIYSKNCLNPIKNLINKGDKKISNFINNVNIRKIDENEIKQFGDPDKIFQNINYFRDIKKFESIN